MKTYDYSVRVEPDLVQHVIRWTQNHGIKCVWKQNDGDTYTCFHGSKASVDRINAFLDGWNARGPSVVEFWKREDAERKAIAERERGKCVHVSQLEQPPHPSQQATCGCGTVEDRGDTDAFRQGGETQDEKFGR